MAVSEETKALIRSLYSDEPEVAPIKASDETKAAVKNYADSRIELLKGVGREVGEGVTLGLLGELASAVKAATSDVTYQRALDEYEAARTKFKTENPQIANKSLPLELLATLPTGVGLARGLAKAGIKSTAKAGAIEGAGYGFASGDSFEERLVNSSVSGVAGFSIGKLVSLAKTPEKSGGFKGASDEALDAQDVAGDQALQTAIEKDILKQQFTQVEKNFNVKPLREAQTAGEFYEGVKKVFTDFYDQHGRGVSDNLWANVSPQIGALVQKANQSALIVFNKELANLTKDLVPVIKVINESGRAKGLLLDFARGGYSNADQVLALRKMAGKNPGADLSKAEKAMRGRAINEFLRDLGEELTAEHKNILKQYLVYSGNKNSQLTKKVFGATSYSQGITYLHTRLSLPARKKKKKDENLTDEQLDDLFEDDGFQKRSRGLYRDKEVFPSEYENPIVSDLHRLQKMNQLFELQKAFGVKTEAIAVGKGRLLGLKQFEGQLAPRAPLTPTEFMNALETTFKTKGINAEGAAYARKQIADMVVGETKAPHPLIQALQSLAYLSTLAGPMSAILNLADVPLIGAKYGGKSVNAGLKSVAQDFQRKGKIFGKPKQLDLEEMGLNNQVFGEFTSAINELGGEPTSLLQKISGGSRKAADIFMRGSGFAAMDRVGKRGVMRGVLSSAVNHAKNKRLNENWGFYFTETELGEIRRQLLKHGDDFTKYTGKGKELIEELMFAGLGQQQLISSAGRPAGWARNPNLRPLWALRGFVVKQQALALREVMGNMKAGEPEKAAKFLGRYALYGAGGYAVINEGRQMIFGNGEASFGGLLQGYGDAWVSLLTANTIGLNDYQLGKIKEEGFGLTMLKGLAPISITRPVEIAGTVIETLDGERPVQAIATEVSPAIKQVGRATKNFGEVIGSEGLVEIGTEVTRKRNPES